MFACDPIRTVERPLLAKGIVLEAEGRRYVLCALDWCELCNDTHDEIQRIIADAAKTDPAHVAVQTVHQHAAPMVDKDAHRLLAEAGSPQLMLDPKTLDPIEERLSKAVRLSLNTLQPFNQIGTGQAKVDRVASNRRVIDVAGRLQTRWSTCKDPDLRALPEGMIDPHLKTITLAHDGRPLVRLHYYATHPQSQYGHGRASSDVVGHARESLETKEHVFQVYFTGCAGNITMGKYNDGSEKCRSELADRLLAGMEASAAATRLVPVELVRWHTYPLRLTARTDPGFTVADSLAHMKDPKARRDSRVYAGAIRAAFHQRSRRPIVLSSLRIGRVCMLNLPGEPTLDYQLFAQGLRPADFVAVAAYGNLGPGYICTESVFTEGGYEPSASNATAESEPLLKTAISTLLGVE